MLDHMNFLMLHPKVVKRFFFMSKNVYYDENKIHIGLA